MEQELYCMKADSQQTIVFAWGLSMQKIQCVELITWKEPSNLKRKIQVHTIPEFSLANKVAYTFAENNSKIILK